MRKWPVRVCAGEVSIERESVRITRQCESVYLRSHALYGILSVEVKRKMDVRSIPLTDLLPPLYPVRNVADEEKMEELARSIAVNGLLNPLSVVPEDGKFRILAGHRRFLALQYIGRTEADCNVLDLDGRNSSDVTIEENLVREDVNPLDLGWYFRHLCEERGDTQAAIGERLGKPPSWVSRYVRLTLVDDEGQVAIQRGDLSWRSALEIQKIEKPEVRADLRASAVARGWSVRQTEAAVSQYKRNEQYIEQAKGIAAGIREQQAANPNPLRCVGCGTLAVERPGDMLWVCVGCQRAIEEAKQQETVAVQ